MTFKSIKTIGGHEALTKHHADGNGIIWAIMDSGIDAGHAHFKKHKNLELPAPLRHRSYIELERTRGKVEIDEDESEEDALVDVFGHGTHVAGILAGEVSNSKTLAASGLHVESIRGIAPLTKLLSVKVISKNPEENSEFGFLKAAEWLLEINKPKQLVHGVLIGLSVSIDVYNFACGHTPVCEAVNDLVRAGMVVVVAAGNMGYRELGNGQFQVFYSSIVDPGNAELAITVGSTHPLRSSPPPLRNLHAFPSC